MIYEGKVVNISFSRFSKPDFVALSIEVEDKDNPENSTKTNIPIRDLSNEIDAVLASIRKKVLLHMKKIGEK